MKIWGEKERVLFALWKWWFTLDQWTFYLEKWWLTRKFKGVPTIFRQSHVLLISGIFTFFFSDAAFCQGRRRWKRWEWTPSEFSMEWFWTAGVTWKDWKNVLAEALPGSYYQASHTFAAAGRRERLGYWCMYVYIYIYLCVWLVRNSINTGSRPPPKSASHLLWPTPAKVSGTWSYGLHGLQGQKSMMAPSCKASKDVHDQPMAEALQSLPSHSRAILSLGAIGTYVHWWNLQILWNCSWMLQVIIATRWIHTPKNPMFWKQSLLQPRDESSELQELFNHLSRFREDARLIDTAPA